MVLPTAVRLRHRVGLSVTGLVLWLTLLLLHRHVDDWAAPIGVSADWAPLSVWLTLAVLTGVFSRSRLLGLGCFFVPLLGAAFAFWGLVVAPVLLPRPTTTATSPAVQLAPAPSSSGE